MHFLILICLTLLFAGTRARADDWPQWRGPGRNAVSSETGLLKTWPEDGPALAWNLDGIGDGYSSVVIADGVAYTTGKTDGAVYCVAIDVGTGTKRWSVKVGETSRNVMSTPTVQDDLIYVLDPDGELLCLQTSDGSIVWQVSFPQDFNGQLMSGRGYGESPLTDGDRLICTPGGPEAMIVSLNRFTGDVIWKSKVPDIGENGRDGAAFSSIGIMQAAGIRQYVQLIGRGLVGVASDNGRFLWGYNDIANTTANIPTPVIRDNLVFCANGYHAGSVVLRIESAQSTSALDQQELTATEVYRLRGNQFQNHHGGFVLIRDHIYGGHGSNNGLPTCINLQTGELEWKKRGPGTGSASVVAADGHLYFHYQDGVIALLEASPDAYHLKSRFRLPGAGGDSWAHPVVSGGLLFLREKDSLYTYSLRQDSGNTQKSMATKIAPELQQLRVAGIDIKPFSAAGTAGDNYGPGNDKQIAWLILSDQHLSKSGSVEDAVYQKLTQLKQPFTLSAADSRISNAGLHQLAGLSQLIGLSLELCPQVNDDSLAVLNSNNNLRFLNLSGTTIGPHGLKHLTKLARLTAIDLEVCDCVSDAACEIIADMKQLRFVNLKKTAFEKDRITGKGVQALASLPLLQSLNLYGNRIDDDALKSLAEHPALQSLNLSLTTVTDAGLSHLASLSKLTELTLLYSEGFAGPKITDAGLEAVGQLRDLQLLDLTGAKITDSGLPELTRLTKLRQLSLVGTNVTSDGVMSLQQELPKCQIR